MTCHEGALLLLHFKSCNERTGKCSSGFVYLELASQYPSGKMLSCLSKILQCLAIVKPPPDYSVSEGHFLLFLQWWKDIAVQKAAASETLVLSFLTLSVLCLKTNPKRSVLV